MSDIYFLGECDVCGKAIAFKWVQEKGLIDYGVNKYGQLHTWIRHLSVAPENANPDCARYSSTVYQVEPPPELLR